MIKEGKARLEDNLTTIFGCKWIDGNSEKVLLNDNRSPKKFVT